MKNIIIKTSTVLSAVYGILFPFAVEQLSLKATVVGGAIAITCFAYVALVIKANEDRF